MPVAKIAKVTFTSADRVRDVIHNFNTDGFDSLYPEYRGGRPKIFTCRNAGRSRRSPSPSRPSTACRFDLEPGQTGRLPGRRGVVEPDGVLCPTSSACSPSSPPRATVGRARRTAQGPRPGAAAPSAGGRHQPARGQASRRLRPGPGQARRRRTPGSATGPQPNLEFAYTPTNAIEPTCGASTGMADSRCVKTRYPAGRPAVQAGDGREIGCLSGEHRLDTLCRVASQVVHGGACDEAPDFLQFTRP